MFASAVFGGVPFEVVSLFFGLIQTVTALTDLIDFEKEWFIMDKIMMVAYCTTGVDQIIMGDSE